MSRYESMEGNGPASMKICYQAYRSRVSLRV